MRPFGLLIVTPRRPTLLNWLQQHGQVMVLGGKKPRSCGGHYKFKSSCRGDPTSIDGNSDSMSCKQTYQTPLCKCCCDANQKEGLDSLCVRTKYLRDEELVSPTECSLSRIAIHLHKILSALDYSRLIRTLKHVDSEPLRVCSVQSGIDSSYTQCVLSVVIPALRTNTTQLCHYFTALDS